MSRADRNDQGPIKAFLTSSWDVTAVSAVWKYAADSAIKAFELYFKKYKCNVKYNPAIWIIWEKLCHYVFYNMLYYDL